MDGSAELLKLAELLGIGAGTARDIAKLRPRDAQAISRLADTAEQMASALRGIVAGVPHDATDDRH